MTRSEQQSPAGASAAGFHPARRIPAAEVRMICGGISDMTLWRWLSDQALNFPRPIYLGRRRYWREAEVLAWLEAREVSA